MKIDYRVYEAVEGNPPPDKRFFCLPFIVLDGKLGCTIFTYGATAEEARAKAEDFWTKEIEKARANQPKKGKPAGRPQTTMVTPAMLAKIDGLDFDPKG